MNPRLQYREALALKLEMIKTAGGRLADSRWQAVDAIRDLARSLGGSAGSNGYPELGAAAKALEACADPDFQMHLDVLVNLMEKLRGQPEPAGADGSQGEAPLCEAPAAGDILLAEDDDVVATIVQHKLEREGFSVFRASDGEEAFKAASTGRFSLFIFDVKMPRLDGFQVLAQLKQSPGYRKTPVLMLTSKNKDTDVRTGILLGVDDYMVKPFLPYELTARVRKLLAKKNPGDKG